jgi:hypothetical protein
MTEILANIILIVSTTFSFGHGIYRCAIVYTGKTHLDVESFTLYRSDEVVYTKEKPGVSSFYLSTGGTVFAVSEKRLYFYAQNGEEVFLKDLNYPNGFGFSPDSMLFFCSDRDGICAYSDQGQLVHKYKPGRLFTSTEHGKKVAVVSCDSLFLYEDGVLKFSRQLRTPYARAVLFSQDGRSIIVEEPLEIEIFNSRTGEKVYHK